MKLRMGIRKRLTNLDQRLLYCLNNARIQKKLYMLYIVCVLVPIIVTDTVIIGVVVAGEKRTRQQEMQNVASAVSYSLDNTIDTAVNLSKNIYANKYINQFLNTNFESPAVYYDAYRDLLQDSLFDSSLGMSTLRTTMYVSNDTLVNGGMFQRIDTILDEKWYQDFEDSNQNLMCYCYFDDTGLSGVVSQRRISVIRRLNFYRRDPYEKFVKIDLDYSSMVTDLNNAHYKYDVYVCKDDQVILSSNGNTSYSTDFDSRPDVSHTYVEKVHYYGMDLEIYVMNKRLQAGEILMNYSGILIILILANAIMPMMFMRCLNYSFVERLSRLNETFHHAKEDHLEEINQVQGNDEIGQLMRDYNRMARRTNELIETVYKSRLNQQEANIAKQNAELLALHSQINPHFLFNILENIRMRSVIKQEDETAEMIERLAMMERQYMDWGTDNVTIEKEAEFVEAYLKLQKYRFGERLSYQIEIDEDCSKYQIPKLSLVTFTENSCVHGIEDKATNCWIFVRVYKKKEMLYFEIEDTGNGMPEGYRAYLQDRMEQANIEMLKEKGRVGIVNACLRLKMVTDHLVHFQVESERGVGTTVTITAPCDKFH